MPFSAPSSSPSASPTTPLHTRRARTLFSAERGPGAFAPVAVPRRKPARPVFHISHDDDDDDDSGSPDEHSPPNLSPVKPPMLSLPSTSVPFPRSGSPTSPTSPVCSPQHPPLQRGGSHPILLANGKPLKSSLKSSASSPNMPRLHLRAASEPPTPAYPSPKNVHFPDNDGSLASIRLFNRSQRPAALSSPNANGDETETGDETNEDTNPGRFPFPVIPLPPSFEIDPVQSATVPAPQQCHPVSPHVILESIRLPVDSKPILSGSVLVRNIAYEKQVALRFTFDDWQTVSETSAKHAMSLPDLPPSLPLSFPHRERGGWDRFTFSIRLEDYVLTLGIRIMVFAVRYRANSAEWWDNNAGGNYKVGFRAAVPPPSGRDRKQVVSYPGAGVSATGTSRENAAGVISSPRQLGIRSTPAPPQVKQPSPTPRTGRLSLLNYSPPPALVVRSRSTTVSLDGSPSESAAASSSSSLKPTIDTTTLAKGSSPAPSPPSSTLNTPNVSPSLVPKIIIGGMPASGAFSPTAWDRGHFVPSEEPEPVHRSDYGDWDWKAPYGDMGDALKAQLRPAPLTRSASDQGLISSHSSSSSISSMEGLPRSSSPPKSDVEGLPLSNISNPTQPAFASFGGGLPSGSLPSDSLYKAFVTQWCFAQDPSTSNQASSIPAWRDGGILA